MKEVDVVHSILKKAMEAFPSSEFIQSLSHQYMIRGWLSKKQLQGLFQKAQKINDLAPGKLATLEAQILKMPNRYKSDLPDTKPMYEENKTAVHQLEAILSRYPEHKRILFLQSKLENNTISSSELAEVEKLHKLLMKK
ncbi:MAG: hypothetical protein H0U44_00870 [Flavisolibacter sp.]|jgi:hypothetical protein|nr:hypothetical protein [Flavisolibacter sp.]